MAAGMSSKAFAGRRYRFLKKVEAAAHKAGLKGGMIRGMNQVSVVDDAGNSYFVTMGRSSMSNGETIISQQVSVKRGSEGKLRSFGSFTWMPYDAPAKPFWDGINKGEFNAASLLEVV
jgi:hypothetical protein